MNKKEYIERDNLISWAKEFYPEDRHFVSGIMNAPTADVEEIVRCKDCQYKSEWVKNGIGEYFCRKSGLWNLTDTCFCHCGSRKEDV